MKNFLGLLCAAFILVASPANARVFTVPGWYLLDLQPGGFKGTAEGPFADEAACKKRMEELDTEEAAMIGLAFDCQYLSEAMPTDT